MIQQDDYKLLCRSADTTFMTTSTIAFDECIDVAMYICNDYDDKIQHLEYSIDEFISAYHSFDINGRNLINELRNAADELEDLTTNCNISTVAASSVGVAGGTVAVVGSFLLPPLLVGGIAIAAASTISNFCIQLVKFTTLRNAVGKLEKLYKRDEELAHKLDELYQIAMLLNLFDAESDSNNKDPSSNLVNGEQIAKSLGMMLCSAPAKCTAAGVHVAGEGLKSVSNTAQLAGGSANGLLNVGVRGGSGLVLRSVMCGALVFGVVIDGVTMFISARDLVKGTGKKLGEILRKQADIKEEQLDRIKERIAASGLITIQKTTVGNRL